MLLLLQRAEYERKNMRLLLSFAVGIGLTLAYTGVGVAQTAKVLDLKAVSQLALQKNPALAGAGALVNQSQATARKAKSALGPQLAVKSNYGYLSEPTFFGSTPIVETNTVINTIELVQPVYTGGQIQSGAAAANYAALAAGGMRASVQSQVLAGASSAYFRALQAREAISIAEASVKSLESSRDSSQKLFSAGSVTKSDVLRNEVALTSANEQLITAQNNYLVALAALKSAIGLPQHEAIELCPNPQDLAIAGIEALSSQTRPEVKAANFGVKAADYQLKAANGALMPSVGVVANYQNQPVGAQFPRLSNTTFVGVQVGFNIFDNGQRRADIDAAKAGVEKAMADYASICQASDFQLQAARLGVDSAKARVETLSTQVKSAEESFRVVQAGYNEGINVVTDVLAVESMLTQARQSRLAAEYDLKIAEVNLLLALGQTQKLTE